MAGLSVGLFALFTLGAAYAYGNHATLWFMETSSDAGFVLTDIEISGLARTKNRDVQAVLDIDSGMPLLAIDLEALQSRIEALPWVKRADINRILPGALTINITEREPFALAQKDGHVRLIDPDGAVITDRGLGEFSHLMLVVGHASPDDLRALEAEKLKAPGLSSRIKSAVRVGGRRWDLIFENGVRIKLPSELATPYGMEQAWMRFVELNERHQLLQREVSVIDLRLPDRLVVRVTPVGRRAMAGEEWAL